MSELHPATRGFAAADVYERGRPGYPAAAVELIVERTGLRPGRRLLDLAAGTGKLTRLLVPSGAEIVAVEPIDEMRARLERSAPGVEALAGTAERIPLPAASVDAVTVAQAFHWFDAEVALREIHRVLRPGGALVLLWNLRDRNDAVQAAVSEIVDPLEAGTPTPERRDWPGLLDGSDLFGPCETASFRHAQTVDEQGLVERVLSISFVGSAPPDVRRCVERRLREIAREHGGRIELPYVTELYLAFREREQ